MEEKPPDGGSLEVVFGTHDPKTNLPNQYGLEILGAQWIAWVAAKHNRTFLTVAADLNKLKEVNDRYGHHSGDIYIALGASALGELLRTPCVLARNGGDEFSALCCPWEGAGSISVEAYEDALLRRFVYTNMEIRYQLNRDLGADNEWMERLCIGFSVGCVRWEKGMDIKELLREADTAMYHQKETVNNQIREEASERLTPEQQQSLNEARRYREEARRCQEMARKYMRQAFPDLDPERLFAGSI